MNTSGNIVLITGGSSGIGLAMAVRFLSIGNRVIITGRDQNKLNLVKTRYPELDVFACDLANQQDLERLVEFVHAKYSGLNLLVNNAGVQFNYEFQEGAFLSDKIEYEVAVNLIAPMKLTAYLLPLLLQNGKGAIINVSSALFMSPKKLASVYCATKSGIHSFTKTLRYQLATTEIKVFEIIPPLVATRMTEGRGKAKITPEELVDEFLRDFQRDKFESFIGKSNYLRLINRISPALADRLMKNA